MTQAQSILHEIVANATNLAPSSKTKYLRDLTTWVDYAGSDPLQWTRRKAQNFYATLLERLKPQSANRLMASLQYATKWWAIQEDNAALNFAIVQMRGGSSEKAEKVALTEELARALLSNSLSNDPIDVRDFALMVVALETGMRRMSLRSITFEHSFFDGDAKTGYPTLRVLMKGRGNDRVMVPLSDTAREALRPWIAWLTNHGISRGAIFRPLARKMDRKGTRQHVAGNLSLSESAITKIIIKRGETIGIELSPHVFRHTFVTWRLMADFSPIEVAAMTAHKLKELGALGEYVDPIAIGRKMRESTPGWLAALVRGRT